MIKTCEQERDEISCGENLCEDSFPAVKAQTTNQL